MQIQLTVKDAAYSTMLSTFDGVDDTERLTNMKRWIKGRLRDKVYATVINRAIVDAEAVITAMEAAENV